LQSFVDQPHAAIDGPNQGLIVNLTDRRAEDSRRCQVQLTRGDPDRVVAMLRKVRDGAAPHLHMPAHHDVRLSDVLLRRLRATLVAAADRGPADFAELLLVPGLGARTVFALAMVSEVVHGAPCRFSDPARFSLAHGGKDGHPFPVPVKVYDETIRVMRDAVARAKLGRDDKLTAIRRLDAQARALERVATGPSFRDFIAAESQRARDYGGRTVSDDRHGRTGPVFPRPPRQLVLL
jgi:hypothetical protein